MKGLLRKIKIPKLKIINATIKTTNGSIIFHPSLSSGSAETETRKNRTNNNNPNIISKKVSFPDSIPPKIKMETVYSAILPNIFAILFLLALFIFTKLPVNCYFAHKNPPPLMAASAEEMSNGQLKMTNVPTISRDPATIILFNRSGKGRTIKNNKYFFMLSVLYYDFSI